MAIANGIRTTYPISLAVLLTMPANTMTTVTRFFGAPSTSARTAVVSNPERSATPTPRIATNTVPSGTKPVKFVVRFWKIQRMPSPVIKLWTAKISPS